MLLPSHYRLEERGRAGERRERRNRTQQKKFSPSSRLGGNHHRVARNVKRNKKRLAHMRLAHTSVSCQV